MSKSPVHSNFSKSKKKGSRSEVPLPFSRQQHGGHREALVRDRTCRLSKRAPSLAVGPPGLGVFHRCYRDSQPIKKKQNVVIRLLRRRIFEHFIDLDLCLRRCYNSCYPMSFIFVCQFSFHRSDRANPSTTCGPRMERRDELACSDLQQIAPRSVANQLQKISECETE